MKLQIIYCGCGKPKIGKPRPKPIGGTVKPKT
jgi:hypothetical protein